MLIDYTSMSCKMKIKNTLINKYSRVVLKEMSIWVYLKHIKYDLFISS